MHFRHRQTDTDIVACISCIYYSGVMGQLDGRVIVILRGGGGKNPIVSRTMTICYVSLQANLLHVPMS